MAAALTPKPLLSRGVHVASNLKRRRHAIGTLNLEARHVGGGSFPTRPDDHVIRLVRSPRGLGRHWIPLKHSSLSLHRSSCRHYTSSYPDSGSDQSPVVSELAFRVSEVEHAFPQSRRLTRHDVENKVWPLLVECASPSSPAMPVGKGGSTRISMSMQQELLDRAKLCSRLLELCLKGVEARRVFLWEWLQNHDTGSNQSNDFSPTAYWNETPHPPKEMFTVAMSAWKSVIESCSSFSAKSVDAMALMESSAQQASSVLFLMEDERSSDAAFIEGYNSQVDKGRYTSLVSGAAIPDVRNYSDVLAAWGQCIDGSMLRLPEKQGRGHHQPISRDGAFQKRLQLEASANKSMMKLLESMEECLYETFGSKPEKMRPPPDRVCYNIILASMARQVSPSLYEMRLVLQRMMERVKYELEQPDDEEGTDEVGHLDQVAMEFFPDAYSYNALIEARANRSAMFASDSSPQPLTQTKLQRHAAWQGQSNPPQRHRKFSSSEEEALLAEQVLLEMDHLITAPVRPNIWSYNAVIKAWIKSDSERGLQRAVMILHTLALNGYNRSNQDVDDTENATNVKNDDSATNEVPSVFGRIVRWGASLLASKKTGRSESHQSRPPSAEKPRHNARAGGQHSHQIPAQMGTASWLNHMQPEEVRELNKASHAHQNRQPQQQMSQVSFGMGGRMALMHSVMQGSGQRRSGNDQKKNSRSEDAARGSEEAENTQDNRPEAIGPLPFVEPNVAPDLKTFAIVVNALERRGTAAAAKVAEGLLQLLEEYYWGLNPDIAIYNSTLNAWSKAAKSTSDVSSCLVSAQRANKLLHRLLGHDRGESGMFPQPTEYSFLMAINAWANAASAAVSAKKIADGMVAARNAEELLGELQKQPLNVSKATLGCYGAVIRTWASVGEAERAQAVLETMAQVSGRLPLDLIHFNAVLDAWAQQLAASKKSEEILPKLSNIRDLLSKMNRNGGAGSFNVDPDTSSFNHVIRACYAPWSAAKTHGDERARRQALETALEVYAKLREGYDSAHRPDAHTYSHMFKAIACLLPTHDKTDDETRATKYEHCQAILRDCCSDGHLAKSSVWIMRKMFPSEDEFAELLLAQMGSRGDNMTKEKLLGIPEDRLFACLPEEWSQEGRRHKSLNRHRQK